MMKSLKNITFGTLAALAFLIPAGFTMTGCETEEGVLEEAGEEMDEAIEEVEDELDDADVGREETEVIQ